MKKVGAVEQEKRRVKRVEFREPLQYAKGAAIPNNGSLGFDLSEGGVRFQTEDFIPLNEPVAVAMQLSPEMILSLHGSVVWIQMLPHSERYQVGVKFHDDDTMVKSRELIKKYVSARSK